MRLTTNNTTMGAAAGTLFLLVGMMVCSCNTVTGFAPHLRIQSSGASFTEDHFLSSSFRLYASKKKNNKNNNNEDLVKSDQDLPLGAFDSTKIKDEDDELYEKEQKKKSDEFHAHADPAHTTPQLLSSLWFLIAEAATTMVKGETNTVLFPQMEDQFTASYISKLMGHLDACKDICDSFGTKTVLLPHIKRGIVKGFTVKSFRDPSKDDKDEEYKFEYDPFWDDGDEWNHEGVDEEAEGGIQKDPYPEIVNRIPDDDDEIIKITKTWVDKMMSDMGICPFTSGPDLAGLPMGNVFYTVDRCTTMEDMYARYWREVVRVEQNNEKDISTILLIAPEFLIDNIELFESFSNTLTQPLTALGVEDLLQLVFFHPQWTFRDGGERSGVGAAANYARRSPWPMINLLRTKQVRTAQRGIPTGLVYKQNEKTLNSIGTDKLETMLRLRDWSDIADIKVDRKEIEALRVARDIQATGTVDEKDTKFAFDSTPAANKVDRRQIEEGDLVNVIKEALEKRLGKNDGGQVTQLTGPETSATVMATDFLLEELERIANATPETTTQEKEKLLQDVMGEDDAAKEEEEATVLVGKEGIMDSGKDDSEGDDSSGLTP